MREENIAIDLFLVAKLCQSILTVMNLLLIAVLSITTITLAQAEQQRQTDDNDDYVGITLDRHVTCQELDRLYKIVDKLADWQSNQITDSEYNLAQVVELDLVEDLGRDNYFVGEEYELWSYDN